MVAEINVHAENNPTKYVTKTKLHNLSGVLLVLNTTSEWPQNFYLSHTYQEIPVSFYLFMSNYNTLFPGAQVTAYLNSQKSLSLYDLPKVVSFNV